MNETEMLELGTALARRSRTSSIEEIGKKMIHGQGPTPLDWQR